MSTILAALSSRRRLLKIVGGVTLVVIVTAIFSHLFYDDLAPESLRKISAPEIGSSATKYDVQGLHLLIPATSTNHHLCQLMVSCAVMGYPAPVLINWDAPEAADA